MPIYIALIIYGIILFFFAIFSFFIVYHLTNFGFLGDMTKAMSFLYILLTLIILIPTVFYILSVPWLELKASASSLQDLLNSLFGLIIP